MPMLNVLHFHATHSFPLAIYSGKSFVLFVLFGGVVQLCIAFVINRGDNALGGCYYHRFGYKSRNLHE